MKFVSAKELDQMISEGKDFQLIDVRESYEYEDNNIGGENIPLDNILSNENLIQRSKPVVLCCQSGKRSAAMAHTIERKFGLQNVHSLEGGLDSYLALKS